MLIRSGFKTQLKNMRANKMRSFLTMLGMIIGISSVIIVLSVGAGAESLILNQLRSVGTNLIGILPGKAEEDGPPAAVFGIVITTLTDEDREAIEDQIPEISAAASYVTANETVVWNNNKTQAGITGTSAGYPEVTESTVVNGHFFTEQEEKSEANVAVLGSQVREDLFNGEDPIGEKIKVGKQRYRVIGVMEPKGVSGFQNVDNMIFIPVGNVQKKLLGINSLGYIRAKANSEENIDIAVDKITELLRDRHNIDNPAKDDFNVGNSNQAIESLGSVTGALTLFLTAISAISLIVGGIGIMNIMLASVTQRIKEIGLRKAVGAKRSHIITQFLTETVLISLFGAIIGIVFGVLFSLLVAILVRNAGYDWDFVITPGSIILACSVSIGIGLLFGIYPARRAANLDPIESLRYE